MMSSALSSPFPLHSSSLAVLLFPLNLNIILLEPPTNPQTFKRFNHLPRLLVHSNTTLPNHILDS